MMAVPYRYTLSNLFGEIDSNEIATKGDLDILHKNLEAHFSKIETDLLWIKRLMLGVCLPVLVVALKYIFVG
ncbi:MAG: hypothetical protein V5788_04450 [Shewanella sp.]